MKQDRNLKKERHGKVWITSEHLKQSREPPVSSVIDALSLEPNSVVVELGAGQGHFTLPIAKRFVQTGDSGRIFAFDVSEKLIKRLDEVAARLGVDDHIRSWSLALMKDPNVLPIDDGAADRVLAFNSLQYLDDPTPICREIARILKPGGVALILNWFRQFPGLEEVIGAHGSPPEKMLTALSEVGLGEYTRLTLDSYSWTIRATKPESQA